MCLLSVYYCAFDILYVIFHKVHHIFCCCVSCVFLFVYNVCAWHCMRMCHRLFESAIVYLFVCYLCLCMSLYVRLCVCVNVCMSIFVSLCVLHVCYCVFVHLFCTFFHFNDLFTDRAYFEAHINTMSHKNRHNDRDVQKFTTTENYTYSNVYN